MFVKYLGPTKFIAKHSVSKFFPEFVFVLNVWMELYKAPLTRDLQVALLGLGGWRRKDATKTAWRQNNLLRMYGVRMDGPAIHTTIKSILLRQWRDMRAHNWRQYFASSAKADSFSMQEYPGSVITIDSWEEIHLE